jgi:fumarate reductase flavoprotein subunit
MASRQPELIAKVARATYPLGRMPGHAPPLRPRPQDAMRETIGVTRTEIGMRRGLACIVQVAGGDRSVDMARDDWPGLPAPRASSTTVAGAEFATQGFRGAHLRIGFPKTREPGEGALTVMRMPGEAAKVGTDPVRFSSVRPTKTVLQQCEPETPVAE